MRQALALALLLSSGVAALVVRPAVRPVASRAGASPLMNLGYQTEAAGSQGFVREAQVRIVSQRRRRRLPKSCRRTRTRSDTPPRYPQSARAQPHALPAALR